MSSFSGPCTNNPIFGVLPSHLEVKSWNGWTRFVQFQATNQILSFKLYLICLLTVKLHVEWSRIGPATEEEDRDDHRELDGVSHEGQQRLVANHERAHQNRPLNWFNEKSEKLCRISLTGVFKFSILYLALMSQFNKKIRNILSLAFRFNREFRR